MKRSILPEPPKKVWVVTMAETNLMIRPVVFKKAFFSEESAKSYIEKENKTLNEVLGWDSGACFSIREVDVG